MKSLIAVAALAAVLGLGQKRSHPQFEVASVKTVDVSKLGNSIAMNIGTVRHDQITFDNATLNDVVRFAHRITSDVQISAPAWTKSTQFLYNINAKGRPGASREDLQDMLQTLLAERFKLVTHREEKQMSYYVLVQTTSKPRIRQVAEVPDGFRGTTYRGRINSILSMPTLAYLLSRFDTERPTIDKTGLRGVYEINLEWNAAQLQSADADAGPSLFTAVTEQLGLKLDSGKGPVEILVVDSAEKIPIPD
jgi:uncharacterized protein (TIGR03435 family)